MAYDHRLYMRARRAADPDYDRRRHARDRDDPAKRLREVQRKTFYGLRRTLAHANQRSEETYA